MSFQLLYEQLLVSGFSELIGTFPTKIAVLPRGEDPRHLEIHTHAASTPQMACQKSWNGVIAIRLLTLVLQMSKQVPTEGKCLAE